MDDPDLETIRKQRLAQLQYGEDGQNSKEQQIKAEEDMKNGILVQILDQSARARLNTLILTKPEKGKTIENMLIQMARTGQISTKIGESELIGLLENVNKRKSTTSVKFDRRRAALDSDDEDL